MNEDVAVEIALLEEQRKECEFAVRDAEWTVRLLEEQRKECKFTVRNAERVIKQKRKKVREIDSNLKRLKKVKNAEVPYHLRHGDACQDWER